MSFQDINLIRNRSEGGIFRDSYIPLSTNGYNFETHAYGGSTWRWSERYVYEYINDEWYMVESETTYGYGSFVTHYTFDDYIKGIGVRGFNSNVFEKIEERGE